MTGSDQRDDYKPEGGASGRSPLDRPIALAAPFLDLLLWVGERVSRLAEPVDHEYYPVRDPSRDPREEDREDREGRDDR